MTAPVIFITGASSGIGAALSVQFAAKGYRVALLARRRDRLEKLEKEIQTMGTQALIFEADVTKPESLEQACKSVMKAWGRIDIVVANAGFAVIGPFSKLSTDDYRRQFETNVFGVLNTFKATEESILASKGILAITGSIAGMLPLPYMTPYTMSKSAVRALAQGLRRELKKKGVAVVYIAPGFVESEIAQVDNQGKFQAEKQIKQKNSLVVPMAKAIGPIVRGILSRKPEVIITGHGKALVFANRYLPWSMDSILKRF